MKKAGKTAGTGVIALGTAVIAKASPQLQKAVIDKGAHDERRHHKEDHFEDLRLPEQFLCMILGLAPDKERPVGAVDDEHEQGADDRTQRHLRCEGEPVLIHREPALFFRSVPAQE